MTSVSSMASSGRTGSSERMADIDEGSPLAHPFQTEAFVALFNTDPVRPHFAIVAEDAAGLAAYWWGYFARYKDGLIPRSNAWVRSGPVVRDDLIDQRDHILSLMLAELKKAPGAAGSRAGDLHLRGALRRRRARRSCLARGFQRYDLQTYLVDLTPSGRGAVEERLDQRSRWAANKARKNGVVVEDAASDEDVRAYYRLYMETGSVPGSGPPSEEQFLRGFRRLHDEGKARIIVARHDGELVAGSFFPCHAGFAAQHQTALSDEGRRLNAGSLLLWESMLSFKNAGFRALDLISVEVAPPEGSREAGVREFKSKWGGELLDTPVYQYWSPTVRVWKAVTGKSAFGAVNPLQAATRPEGGMVCERRTGTCPRRRLSRCPCFSTGRSARARSSRSRRRAAAGTSWAETRSGTDFAHSTSTKATRCLSPRTTPARRSTRSWRRACRRVSFASASTLCLTSMTCSRECPAAPALSSLSTTSGSRSRSPS